MPPSGCPQIQTPQVMQKSRHRQRIKNQCIYSGKNLVRESRESSLIKISVYWRDSRITLLAEPIRITTQPMRFCRTELICERNSGNVGYQQRYRMKLPNRFDVTNVTARPQHEPVGQRNSLSEWPPPSHLTHSLCLCDFCYGNPSGLNSQSPAKGRLRN